MERLWQLQFMAHSGTILPLIEVGYLLQKCLTENFSLIQSQE